MKILIVAGAFPPYAPSAASRANKLAKFLEQKGHDIRVLAPKLLGQHMSLTPEISEDKIIFTDYYDINDFPTSVKNSIKNLFLSKNNQSNGLPIGEKKPVENNYIQDKESKISIAYRYITNIPDRTIGWYPAAIRAGRELFNH